MMPRRKLKKLLLISLGVISMAALIICSEIFNKYDAHRSPAVSTTNAHGTNSVVREIDLQYAANYANDSILMGASHNIFIGKVIDQIGNKERGIGPETQFSVQIVSNIKGVLSGVVTVDQQGGYEDGTLYVVGENDVPGINSEDGSQYLLQPGATYLLATRYNPTENWYTLNSFPTASKLISNDNALSATQLQPLAANDPRVQQLQAAYSHEILLQADIAHNNTLNSYASAHPIIHVSVIPTSTPVISTTTVHAHPSL